MAKKKTIIEETIPDNPQTGAEIENEFNFDGDSDILLDKVKAQYGGNLVKIKVYKIVVGKGQPVFCFQSEEHVDEEQLQQTYGGGAYVLRFFVDGVLKHTERVEVADKPNANGNGTVDARDIQIQMMRDQNAWTQNLLLSLLTKQNPISPPTPMQDIVQAWSLINGGGGVNKIDSMIDLFTKGMELGAKGGGGGEMDWKSALISTAKELAPVITNAISVASGRPAANGTAITAAAQQLPPDELLKQGIAYLKTRILAGLPVGLALDWIVANANDPQYQPFLQLVVSKSFEDLAKIDADLANDPFNTWFRQFLDGLKEHFKAAAEPEGEDKNYE